MIHRVLVGATASGKKSVAVELHERHGWPLLSMDSMKVYRGMDVGTDKPSAEQQRRAPFALLDLVGHDESFSAGRWIAAALQAGAGSGGPEVLFAGGTPLYLRLLLAGLCPAPPADPQTRAELEELWEREGEAVVRSQLAAVDAESAARLSPGDRKRVVRALEVARLTGRSLSSWQREHTRPALPGRLAVVVLRRSPADQQQRQQARVERMLATGLIEEVDRLAAAAPFARESGRAIGYAEVLALREGRLTRADLPARIALRTRQMARKQRMHLESLPGLVWVDVSATATVQAVADEVEAAFARA
ncbi:MAG: tRNA (adenosine(37)-N6)-dimethylallyltransferase MiaA [Planctomycetota bacterium]